jgi:hypothetical protein
MSDGQPPPQPPAPVAPRALVPLAAIFYGAMLAGAWLWLWMRGRLARLTELALGDYGLFAAAGAGLGAGLLAAGALALLARRVPAVRACEARIAAVVGGLQDPQLLQLALLSAIGEEAFFRVAAQDEFGLPVAVAVYAALSTGPGFWAWAPIAAGAAALFGGLLCAGAGLLAATTAHAIATYLSLRRIVLP